METSFYRGMEARAMPSRVYAGDRGSSLLMTDLTMFHHHRGAGAANSLPPWPPFDCYRHDGAQKRAAGFGVPPPAAGISPGISRTW